MCIIRSRLSNPNAFRYIFYWQKYKLTWQHDRKRRFSLVIDRNFLLGSFILNLLIKVNEGGFNPWLVHMYQQLFNNMVEGESNSFSVVLLPQLSVCYMADILKETYIMKTETLRSYLYLTFMISQLVKIGFLLEIFLIALLALYFLGWRCESTEKSSNRD